jgi:hypothetical protein
MFSPGVRYFIIVKGGIYDTTVVSAEYVKKISYTMFPSDATLFFDNALFVRKETVTKPFSVHIFQSERDSTLFYDRFYPVLAYYREEKIYEMQAVKKRRFRKMQYFFLFVCRVKNLPVSRVILSFFVCETVFNICPVKLANEEIKYLSQDWNQLALLGF